MVSCYLLKTPTLAVATDAGGARRFVRVPSNSVVEVTSPIDGLHGLIEVSANGGPVLMFAEDIKERGKRALRASRS